MIELLRRLVVAVESIAKDLSEIRAEQRQFMEMSRKEADRAPERMMELFDRIRLLAGGDRQ